MFSKILNDFTMLVKRTDFQIWLVVYYYISSQNPPSFNIYIYVNIYLDDARRKIPPSVFQRSSAPAKNLTTQNQKLSSREKPRKSKIKNAARREITEAVY